ncbi:MAG TPA: glycerophosphodiester phosphodiesterase family protein, partial [Planctomycetota bacterium]|nr:glycerophosphodiester phosphodiesterase family protein [Planctomycetota bacterium]
MSVPDPLLGAGGAHVPGPPWILGARGAPRLAPENTWSALAAALEQGLDGVAYDLRACASGELVLCADARLERTTDAEGRLAARTLPELADVDAGGWFDARFAGERLALFEEALALEGNRAGSWPQHLVVLREDELAGEVARVLSDEGRHLSVRVATRRRETALALRDLGLSPLWIVPEPDDDVRGFLRRERIAACGLVGRAWPREGRDGWPSERWSLDLELPDDLLAACAAPVNALTTREGARALAARALASVGVDDPPRWPLAVDALSIEPALGAAAGGQWTGRWTSGARVHNPFGWPCAFRLALCVRQGAFESEGLPALGELAPGESRELSFELRGGSFAPGGDPTLALHLAWPRGPGRPGEALTFDAPLSRVRALHLAEGATRLPLLVERPGDPPASVHVRRLGLVLVVKLENAGGLEDARLIAHLDGVDVEGGATLRLRLPRDA